MNNLKIFYKEKFIKFGPTFQGAGWGNKIKAKKRFKCLIKIFDYWGKKKRFSILDVGCGYGELINFLEKKKLHYEYLGVDIVDQMINHAKKKNKKKFIKFKKENFFKIKKRFDFIFCNGVFTLKNNLKDKPMYNYINKSLDHFYKISKYGFCFNIMSENVDYKSKILFYPNIDRISQMLNFKKFRTLKIDSKSIKYEKMIYFLK